MSIPAKEQRKKALGAPAAKPIRKKLAARVASTKGARLAREMRQECNKLNDEQRAELLNDAMAMIYGDADAPKAARP